ncbi:hypothetical protein HBI16_001970 [Parastagonospora nodorum]|nr:hypothetical protein HBI16_001970 [Parastagonospora nodorum]
MPSIAFISNVYIANSLRARILINLSAVLYKQAAAQTSLSAKVSNIDLNFVPSVTFIPNVYIANSLRARTLINLSAVLLRARTLINLSAVLYKQVSIIDLDFMPSIAFNAIENVELIGDFLTALLNPRLLASKCPILSSSDLNYRRTNSTIAIRDNIEKLIYISKVKNNCNNLNIIVTNPTSREFSRVNIKSLTKLCLLIDRAKLLRPVFKLQRYNYYNLQDTNVTNVFNIVISKLDKVPTRELSSYIKTELYPLRDNSRKFYYLVITSKDTHCKQIIKKAYIILLERALLILFIT